jgi:DNA-binding response OmpR family regulator
MTGYKSNYNDSLKNNREIRILIVDDEERIREMIREYIEPQGYIIGDAADGLEALAEYSRQEYSLIVMDIMMPGLDGWSLAKEIRKKSQVPIIMLTARGEEYDKLLGFELGVDDYIVKPFSPKELLARIKAILRRSTNVKDNSSEESFILNGLAIEFFSRNVYIDGKLTSLTPKEYDLLVLFVKNPGRVFSRDQLLSFVWKYDFSGDNRTVDTHIKMLRDSLGSYRKYIITVWGTGYKFEVRGEK